MRSERFDYIHNGKKYIYEITFLRNRYWLAFLGDFMKFNTKKEAKDYISKNGKKIITEYLAEFPNYNGNGEGFLPADDEERDLMFTEYDEKKALFGKDLQRHILELEGVRRTRGSEQKKQVTFRLDSDDIKKIKEIANQEGIPYQTLIGAIIHKVANKKIELSIK